MEFKWIWRVFSISWFGQNHELQKNSLLLSYKVIIGINNKNNLKTSQKYYHRLAPICMEFNLRIYILQTIVYFSTTRIYTLSLNRNIYNFIRQYGDCVLLAGTHDNPLITISFKHSSCSKLNKGNLQEYLFNTFNFSWINNNCTSHTKGHFVLTMKS